VKNYLKKRLSTSIFTYLCILGLVFTGLSAEARGQTFSLLHTAGVRGLASNYHYGINTPYLLIHDYAREPLNAVRELRTAGASIYFYHQGLYIWGEKMGVQDFHLFLKQLQQMKPLQKKPIQVLDTPDSIVLEAADQHALVKSLALLAQSRKYDQTGIERKEAILETYPGPFYLLRLPEAPLQASSLPEEWEMLLGLQMDLKKTPPLPAHQLLLIGKPEGEGARRSALLKELKGEHQLLVDSGNLLEGLSSIHTASLSLQRSNSLHVILQTGYFALNIGAEELQGGLDNLLRESDQFHLPWISSSIRQAGKAVFPAYRLARSGQKVLALIGIGNPDELSPLQEAGLLGKGLEILQPQEALKTALEEIKLSLGREADAVILLTTLEGRALEDLVETSQGIDVVLGDTGAPLQASRESIEAPRDRERLPFKARNNPHALGLLQLDLLPQRVKIENEVLPISFDAAPDPQVLAEIMRIRQKAYLNALDILLPDLGPTLLETPALRQIFLQSTKTRNARKRLEGLTSLSDQDFLRLYPPRMTAEIWSILTSNLLLENFNCEVVLLKSPEDAVYMPGAWPRLLAYELLKQDDTVALYDLSGTQLAALLKLADASWIKGGLSHDNSKVWNRPLQKNAYYRTLISSSLSNRSDFSPILKGSKKREELKNPFSETPNKREILYLRNILLGFLEKKQSKGKLSKEIEERLLPHWEKKQSLLSLKISDLQLTFSGYNALNNQTYSAVRETRVTSPNNLTYGGRTKLSLIFDNEPLTFTNSVQAKFEGLSLLDESSKQTKFTESQDDLVFSSEMQLHLFEFPMFGKEIQLIPYLEGIYDTEFTPTVKPDTQTTNPRQAELSGVAGLTIPAGPVLKAFKTGLALRRDFNVPNNIELGLNFKLDHDYPLTSALRWNNTLDFKYYLPSPNDNSSSLGLITQWVSAMKVSLTDNLSLRIFADAYLFQGKLPSTSQLGASVILGVGLAYDRLWKPGYESIF